MRRLFRGERFGDTTRLVVSAALDRIFPLRRAKTAGIVRIESDSLVGARTRVWLNNAEITGCLTDVRVEIPVDGLVRVRFAVLARELLVRCGDAVVEVVEQALEAQDHAGERFALQFEIDRLQRRLAHLRRFDEAAGFASAGGDGDGAGSAPVKGGGEAPTPGKTEGHATPPLADHPGA